jgi:hypothetical protein
MNEILGYPFQVSSSYWKQYLEEDMLIALFVWPVGGCRLLLLICSKTKIPVADLF